MKSIVQYHNDLNQLQIGNFKEKEIDVFFAICFKIKNQGTSEVILTFEELRELTKYSHRSIEKFCKVLDNTYKNLLSLNFRIEDEEKIVRFVLFTEYEINKTNKNLTIRVNEKFKYLLNDFISNYTKLDLAELVSLKGTYSKNMYKLLKQYRSSGWYDINIDEFRSLLGIPDYYKMGNIDQKVLNPILEELDQYFPNLKIEKIKRGRKIDRIKFIWDVNPVEKVSVMPKEDVIDEAMQNKINAVKAAISILDDTEILALLDVADVGVILEKYYTLAVGKNIDNLTGFLMAAIKNDWKKTPKKAEEKKAVQGEMDELERKLQKRLFDKLNNRGN